MTERQKRQKEHEEQKWREVGENHPWNICKSSKTAVSSFGEEPCYRKDKSEQSFCQFTT